MRKKKILPIKHEETEMKSRASQKEGNHKEGE